MPFYYESGSDDDAIAAFKERTDDKCALIYEHFAAHASGVVCGNVKCQSYEINRMSVMNDTQNRKEERNLD